MLIVSNQLYYDNPGKSVVNLPMNDLDLLLLDILPDGNYSNLLMAQLYNRLDDKIDR